MHSPPRPHPSLPVREAIVPSSGHGHWESYLGAILGNLLEDRSLLVPVRSKRTGCSWFGQNTLWRKHLVRLEPFVVVYDQYSFNGNIIDNERDEYCRSWKLVKMVRWAVCVCIINLGVDTHRWKGPAAQIRKIDWSLDDQTGNIFPFLPSSHQFSCWWGWQTVLAWWWMAQLN